MLRLVVLGIGVALLAGIVVMIGADQRSAASGAALAQEVDGALGPAQPEAEPIEGSDAVAIVLGPETDPLKETIQEEFEDRGPTSAIPADSNFETSEASPAILGSTVGQPIRLRIPVLGVDADVEYVSLAEDGSMDVPKDASNVAWYQPGPTPGSMGNAIIAGHVDWGGRAAVFWGLRNLTPGNVIQVVAEDGAVYEFSVDWLEWYDAETERVDEVFGQSVATELTLITCGGSFDQRTRQYLSRLVVRSSLVTP